MFRVNYISLYFFNYLCYNYGMLLLQVESLYQDATYCLSVTPFNCQHQRNYYL